MLYIIPPTQIPGIGAAAAYAASDQMGTALMLEVPKKGTILEMRWHDLDDEGLNKEVWCFDFEPTLAADNAAFSLADSENFKVQAIFLFDVWRDAVNNQVGLTANTPAAYYVPEGQLWLAVKTLGTDNIAAGAMPMLSLVIEVED